MSTAIAQATFSAKGCSLSRRAGFGVTRGGAGMLYVQTGQSRFKAGHSDRPAGLRTGGPGGRRHLVSCGRHSSRCPCHHTRGRLRSRDCSDATAKAIPGHLSANRPALRRPDLPERHLQRGRRFGVQRRHCCAAAQSRPSASSCKSARMVSKANGWSIDSRLMVDLRSAVAADAPASTAHPVARSAVRRQRLDGTKWCFARSTVPPPSAASGQGQPTPVCPKRASNRAPT